jgi:hypothetical protein
MSDFLPLATDLRTSREARFVLISRRVNRPDAQVCQITKEGAAKFRENRQKAP